MATRSPLLGIYGVFLDLNLRFFRSSFTVTGQNFWCSCYSLSPGVCAYWTALERRCIGHYILPDERCREKNIHTICMYRCVQSVTSWSGLIAEIADWKVPFKNCTRCCIYQRRQHMLERPSRFMKARAKTTKMLKSTPPSCKARHSL